MCLYNNQCSGECLACIDLQNARRYHMNPTMGSWEAAIATTKLCARIDRLEKELEELKPKPKKLVTHYDNVFINSDGKAQLTLYKHASREFALLNQQLDPHKKWLYVVQIDTEE